MSGIRVDKATPEEAAAAEAKFGTRPRGTVDLPDPGARAQRTDVLQTRAEGKARLMAAIASGEVADGADATDAVDAETRPAPKKPALKPAAAAPVEDVEDELELDADDDVIEDDLDADDDIEAEGDTDAETNRRVATVKAAEKRSREKTARREAELARRETALAQTQRELQAQIDEMKEIRRIAKLRPSEALAKLDPSYGEDDYDFAARDAFARTKAAADPKNREAVARMQKEREGLTRVEKLERELEEMKTSRETERTQVQNARAADAYLDRVVKTASDETPLLQRHLEKNAQGARVQLTQIAIELAEKLGGAPSAKSVLKVYEKRRRAELAELGVDVDALVGRKATDSKKKPAASAATPKDQPLAAGKDRPAATPTPATSGIRGREQRKSNVLHLLDEEDAKSA